MGSRTVEGRPRAAEQHVLQAAEQALKEGRRMVVITASGDRARTLRNVLRRNGLDAKGHQDTEPADIRVVSIRWAEEQDSGISVILDLHDSRKPDQKETALSRYGAAAELVLAPEKPEPKPGADTEGGAIRPINYRRVRVECLP